MTQPLCRALLLALLILPLPAAAEDGPVPPEPALAPPTPARLPDRPAPARGLSPATVPALALPPGMEALPSGAWRLRFPTGAAEVPEAAAPALAELGRRLAAGPPGRVTILAQASGPEDVSTARRLSLARGFAVKQALAEGGLPPTRIDIRPMGRTADGLDSADIQPPPSRGTPGGTPGGTTDRR
ncbi:OmpA family protein [Siccirubricoccus phaeus]|uniref:OmpA family protein n=1 Tax=Siccirubricoccus phaeus TaxID=2595053 RepID=UPI0011F366F0|nr:OmpA family protein [Siccirubricoccus phaeus]